MKLLLDQNLSPRLSASLAKHFPGTSHVQTLGLASASDDVIWKYAASHRFVIVTKDEDYNTLSILQGFPPKVLWLQLGNCTTKQVEEIFHEHCDAIRSFIDDPIVGTMVIRRTRHRA